jgi:hypothetical protein
VPLQLAALVILGTLAAPQPDNAFVATVASDSAAMPAASNASVRQDGPDPIRIERAVHRLRPGQLLRIRGEFGERGRVAEFEGFAERVRREGLGGLRSRREGDWNSSWPRELTWDRIGRIEERGNSAARGALTGAVVVGIPGTVLGLLAGAIAGTLAEGNGRGAGPILAGGAIGFVGGGALGAALGGLYGLAVPRWNVIYERQ